MANLPRLQALANLVIIAGNRDDIREMSDGPQGVLTELLLVADCYDLYGRVALAETPLHLTKSPTFIVLQRRPEAFLSIRH